MSPDVVEIAIKAGGALIAGSLIGLERTFHGRPAGFRTHALVCMASAVLMQVTEYQWQWLTDVPVDTIRTDPTRMAQGIMTGIGFLGAGVIFREGVTVRGLTTAASIWTTAALGILYGIGLYYTATLATLVVLGVLAVFRRLEDHLPSQHYARHLLRFAKDKAPTEAELRRLLDEHGFEVVEMSYALVGNGAEFEYHTVLMTRRRANLARLVERLRTMEDLLEFRISPTSD